MRVLKLSLIAAICLSNSAFASTQAQEAEHLKMRVELLEKALQPTSAASTVKLFADAVMTRNGAVQYMLFCPDVQKKVRKGFEEMNWVTGTSSPTANSYKVTQISEQKYSVRYNMVAQGQPLETMEDQFTVHEEGTDEHDARFCISEYARK